MDLSTKYMGITLKNPIIVGASNLVQDVKNLKKLEQVGASAIVYKSLFEEQIQLESLEMQNDLESYENWDPEHATLFPDLEHAGPAEFLMHLKEAREVLNIPLFASLNAVYEASWIDYAKKISETGVAGIELNFYHHENDFDKTSEQIENEQLHILKKVKEVVNIPVSVKLSPYYTNTLRMVKQLDRAGADAFIMFNRLFQPDIDIEKEEHHFPYNFSSRNDNGLALRYAGLLHSKIRGSICSNTGIHSGSDVIKMLLAGADAVQVVSTIYRKGISHIATMLGALEEWMIENGYESLSDFKGKLSSKKTQHDLFTYKRAQYVDILLKSENFNKYHPKSEGELTREEQW
ncbi:MAG: dihydroorotate dehydrogenase [Thalassobius sp.]|nr:dihydroorotate dehydrogenase [Thalassovita sp.]